MSYQITWIKKPNGSHNPHTRIEEVGGPGWSKKATEVISDILNSRNSYYVSVSGVSVDVEVGIHEGRYYLRTRSDGTPLDNLLSLENRDN